MSNPETFAGWIREMGDQVPVGDCQDALHEAAQEIIDEDKNFTVPSEGDLAAVFAAFQIVVGALIAKFS